jgi:hypothetical protein
MEAGAASRGHELLLAHCEMLAPVDEERPSSFERLVDSVGSRLAALLVAALAGDHGMRSRG